MKCIFCNPEPPCILVRNAHAYARFDQYPVTPGHTLIIPYRHITNPFEMTEEERQGMWNLLSEVREMIEESYHPDGFNLGVNIGEAAGQTIPHLHVHLIPRYRGDMRDPRGGVRGVIPKKQHYSGEG
jgi:diadenosine tetraphosphate (Ap4A) HIT family hydrolase